MAMPEAVYLCPATPDLAEQSKTLAARWQLPYQPHCDNGLVLVNTPERLELRQLDEPRMGAVYVDFASAALTFRRLHGGGRKEAIAKAIGIKGEVMPRVLDATAGLGRDAFVLAALGCTLDLIERSPVVAALLDDGLCRAAKDPSLGTWLPKKMHLFHGVSYDLLSDWKNPQPEVVYLDPMYPHRKKAAKVKKDMDIFQQLLGQDLDADSLLAPAVALAGKRVVVKRPGKAPWLDGKQPNMAITGKKHRFDVYMTAL